MLDPKNIFPIGIGTWGIGGLAERDPKNNDPKQTEALTYMLNKGMNIVELNPWYSEWRAVELFTDAIHSSDKVREDIFVVGAIYHYKNETLKDAEEEIEKLLKKLDSDYLDSVQFIKNGFEKWGLGESFKLMDKLLNSNCCRYISVSNCDLVTLQEAHKEFGDKLFSHELQYNFEVRFNEELGIVDYAKENGIKNVAYQPLRRNRTAKRNWPLLVELSDKYGKSQNQVILNWLISKGMLPITKSDNIQHIDEALSSLEFDIEKDDLKKVDNFKLNVDMPKLAWKDDEEGLIVHQLSNKIDDIIDGKYES